MIVQARCWLHDVSLTATGECDECSKLLPIRSSVMVFDDGDDNGYRDWVVKHRGGYVINIQRGYNATDAVLHQAACGTINGEPSRGDVFVGHCVKLCALRRRELDEGGLQRCGGD